jgi:hypothetical protein
MNALAAAWFAWPCEPRTAAAEEYITKKSSGCPRVSVCKAQLPSTFGPSGTAKRARTAAAAHRLRARRPRARCRATAVDALDLCDHARPRRCATSAAPRVPVHLARAWRRWPRQRRPRGRRPTSKAPSSAGHEPLRREQAKPREATSDEVRRPVHEPLQRSTHRIVLHQHDLPTCLACAMARKASAMRSRGTPAAAAATRRPRRARALRLEELGECRRVLPA